MKSLPKDEQKKIVAQLKAIRKKAKVVTYSAMYGIGEEKLARSIESTKAEAKALLEAFWEMNWAVKKVAETSYVKELKDGSRWIKNPVSGFYYSLRSDKDRWSTINQGTGVYCFDTWCYHARKLGVGITASFHDEVVIATDDPDGVQEKLQKAIQQTNDKLQLNVPLGIDVQRGKNYADVH
jgi:DNA polymerase I-like protein with 3'-5' exonuclease and polymerase domains